MRSDTKALVNEGLSSAYLKILIKETLCPRKCSKHSQAQSWLNSKSWVVSCFISLTRLLLIMIGDTPWGTVYDSLDTRKDVHVDRVRSVQSANSVALISLTILGAILNIIVYKKREVAGILIYYEALYVMLVCLVPYDYGDTRDAYLLARVGFILIGFTCRP